MSENNPEVRRAELEGIQTAAALLVTLADEDEAAFNAMSESVMTYDTPEQRSRFIAGLIALCCTFGLAAHGGHRGFKNKLQEMIDEVRRELN